MAFRNKPELKREVDTISYNLGLNTSDVIRVFLKKFVAFNGFPFAVNNDYNLETKNTMNDVKNGKGIIKVKNGLSGLKSILDD